LSLEENDGKYESINVTIYNYSRSLYKTFVLILLQSDTCMIKIPDLDMELIHTSDAGRFTTLEGLLGHIKDGVCN